MSKEHVMEDLDAMGRHLWIILVAEEMEMPLHRKYILVIKSSGLADGVDAKCEENEWLKDGSGFLLE